MGDEFLGDQVAFAVAEINRRARAASRRRDAICIAITIACAIVTGLALVGG